MAFINWCNKCNKDTAHGSYGCIECRSKEIRNEKENYLQERSKLTIEERLILIESELFDHNQNHSKNQIMYQIRY